MMPKEHVGSVLCCAARAWCMYVRTYVRIHWLFGGVRREVERREKREKGEGYIGSQNIAAA